MQICSGLWKTAGEIWFVLITKSMMKHQWEGYFYNKDGVYKGTSRWKDNGEYFMSDMSQYKLIERKRGTENGWPNVPQM
jgi:hypothetical protein